MSPAARELSDMWVLASRSVKRIARQPDLLVGYTVQPIMFVLLFVYVFGGAVGLALPSGVSYVNYLIPGIVVQSITFGGFVTALGLSDDLKKGLMDRFRSLPMSRSAVVTGRTFADISTNIIQLVVMLAVGLAVGFRFQTDIPTILGGIALLLLIGYAFSWVFAFIGLAASSPEASNAYGFTILFPVTFVSSAFVPVGSMPSWLQTVARHNPFTDMVNAIRRLFIGTPAGHDVWLAALWSVAIAIVFAALAIWRYRRVVAH
ncbi:MAG TPA: ABC transporter permease [Gaiellaceae bacterium]